MPPTGVRAVWRGGGISVEGSPVPESLAVAPVAALSLGDDLVTTAGAWERGDGSARFTPRFGAVPGTEFAVVELLERDTGDGGAGGTGAGDSDAGGTGAGGAARSPVGRRWREVARVSAPAPKLTATTVVEAIEPAVAEVPANLLRLSILFSRPMEQGSATGRVHLLDASGDELPGSLLDTELWDADRRRLTVLLEPGRIKRGLQPHKEAGAPLTEGCSVTVVVDTAVRDESGAPLTAEARRTYRVTAPWRSRIDPTRWLVTWPTAAQDPLRVAFDRPLDRVLAHRYLVPTDATGRRVPGRVVVDAEARSWTFFPAATADPVESLHVDVRLEDLAGNSVRRVFDRDLTSRADDSLDATEVVLRAPAR